MAGFRSAQKQPTLRQRDWRRPGTQQTSPLIVPRTACRRRWLQRVRRSQTFVEPSSHAAAAAAELQTAPARRKAEMPQVSCRARVERVFQQCQALTCLKRGVGSGRKWGVTVMSSATQRLL